MRFIAIMSVREYWWLSSEIRCSKRVVAVKSLFTGKKYPGHTRIKFSAYMLFFRFFAQSDIIYARVVFARLFIDFEFVSVAYEAAQFVVSVCARVEV